MGKVIVSETIWMYWERISANEILLCCVFRPWGRLGFGRSRGSMPGRQLVCKQILRSSGSSVAKLMPGSNLRERDAFYSRTESLHCILIITFK